MTEIISKNKYVEFTYSITNDEGQIIEQVESEEDTSVLPIIKNKVSSTMKFYILKKKLTIKNTIFNNQIDNNLDYDTPYKT